MEVLRALFGIVGSLPLIGPDGVCEADLLLHSDKPVGMFVDFKFPNHIHEEYSAPQERIRADIRRLDLAVLGGKINKHSFTVQGKEQGWSQIWSFYCQKGREQDMLEISELHQAALENRKPRIPITKDCGEYLGYRKGDIGLFKFGGYDALPFPINEAFKATHDFRLKCRIATRLGKMPDELDI